jgi:hypothetical protein
VPGTYIQPFGKNCLLARRLVERGVRFVQLYHGAGSKWDSHSAIEKNHSKLCESSDKPVAGLLAYLNSVACWIARLSFGVVSLVGRP